MFIRFWKWLVVALIAAAIVIALRQAPDSSPGEVETGWLQRLPGDQRAPIAAIPCAPALQLAARSSAASPPIA